MSTEHAVAIPEENIVALPVHNGGAMAVLTEKRIALLSKTIANGAPPLEFEMFINICNRTRLDPFAKQIYFVQRGGNWTIQTGIDGYRLIAERTGLYAGSDDPVYDTETEDHPSKSTVTVWKMVAGVRCPFTATARWDEYVPPEKQAHMWRKMPYLMLGKVAEALALRKAFPQDLSGLYTVEEMDQAREQVDTATGEIIEHQPPRSNGDDRQRAMSRLWSLAKQRGLSDDDLRAVAYVGCHVASMTELKPNQISTLITRLETASDADLRAGVAACHAKLNEGSGDQDVIEAEGTPVASDEPIDGDFDPASPIPDFLKQIKAAKDEASLNAITQSMQAIGVWAPEVTTAVVDKRNALGLPAPQADKGMRPVGDIIDQAPLLSGEPGMDRHSS